MNGIMLGPWGCITYPDNPNRKNVLTNEDGSIEVFELGKILEINWAWREIKLPLCKQD